MKEIEVIGAFVNGRPAETETLKSDGQRLYTEDYVVAVWGSDGIEMDDTRTPPSRSLLRELLQLQIERDELARRLRERRGVCSPRGEAKALCA